MFARLALIFVLMLQQTLMRPCAVAARSPDAPIAVACSLAGFAEAADESNGSCCGEAGTASVEGVCSDAVICCCAPAEDPAAPSHAPPLPRLADDLGAMPAPVILLAHAVGDRRVPPASGRGWPRAFSTNNLRQARLGIWLN